MRGFLKTGRKEECLGCEACVQICPKSALKMEEDNERFRYPALNKDLCIDCGLCNKACPIENAPKDNESPLFVFGGYSNDSKILCQSTSGGAFSCLAKAFFDNYEHCSVFGATANGLRVFHASVDSIKHLHLITKSKYCQSEIQDCYRQAYETLNLGKSVLFSGTPCQIAGLYSFLGCRAVSLEKLLTIEVICEGVPSPLYIQKFCAFLEKKNNGELIDLDYRCKTSKSSNRPVKWDYEVMQTIIKTSRKDLKINIDRWFNPFWSIWLQHLMSRPSCYECPYARVRRIADITLGDLWGVHKYCPELYNKNRGTSLVLCNTHKGKNLLDKAAGFMEGHELSLTEALRYQGPLRKPISLNPHRQEFMRDLEGDSPIEEIINKWTVPHSLRFLLSKYVWGNHRKVRLWKLKSLFLSEKYDVLR